MALDRNGDAVVAGDVYVLAGKARRIDGDVVVVVLNSGQVLRVLSGDVLPIDGIGGGGVTDHGALTGLTPDDDHPQYVKADGTRAFTATVTGVNPTSSLHLSTRAYVDNEISVLSFFALGFFQPLDATLTALAGLATGANKLAYSTGTDSFAQTDLTLAGRALLDDATAAAQRTTLGIVDTGWANVSKTADQSKSSDTTFASDATLTFTLNKSTDYLVRGRVFFTTTATADFKFRFTGPASPTSVRIMRKGVAGGAAAYSEILIDTAYSVAVELLGAGVEGLVEFDAIIENGLNAGAFAFQWAQSTSSATNTTVLEGSYLEYRTF
jgi:hypothetical protein